MRIESAVTALLTAVVFAPGLAPTAHGETLQISAPDLLSRAAAADAPLILDVRTPEEYRDGHVPGAVNLPHDQIVDRLSELEAHRDRDVVVYCRSGRRAGVAADHLSEAGFRVLHLDGDMNGWRADGRAEERKNAP